MTYAGLDSIATPVGRSAGTQPHHPDLSLSATQAKRWFSDLMHSVTTQGRRFHVTYRGQVVAVLIPPRDYARLLRAEREDQLHLDLTLGP